MKSAKNFLFRFLDKKSKIFINDILFYIPLCYNHVIKLIQGVKTMNKKLIISLSLVTAISVSTIAAMADTTIYTDGIGRLHFLGRDAANNKTTGANYSNSAEQDLTRKLYDEMSSGVVNDTSYDQHPVKNYENTFPDSRFTTTKFWKTKYSNDADDETTEAKNTTKRTVTAVKGQTDYTNAYGSTFLDNKLQQQNTTSTKTTKKHWWNKK